MAAWKTTGATVSFSRPPVHRSITRPRGPILLGSAAAVAMVLLALRAWGDVQHVDAAMSPTRVDGMRLFVKAGAIAIIAAAQLVAMEFVVRPLCLRRRAIDWVVILISASAIIVSGTVACLAAFEAAAR